MNYNIYEIAYDYRFNGQNLLIIGEESLRDVGEFLVTELGEEFIPGFRVNSYRDTGFKTNRKGIISPTDFITDIRNRKRMMEHLMRHGSPTARAYAAGPDSPEWEEAMKGFWDIFGPKDSERKESSPKLGGSRRALSTIIENRPRLLNP
jgi:hypothetical protein